MNTTDIEARNQHSYSTATAGGGAALVVSALVVVAASLVARFFSYPVMSGDWTASLSHWMDALKGSPGLSAFHNPFSDYPPLYLYMLKGLTMLQGYGLYWIKTLSFAFDIVLAAAACLILKAYARARYMPGLYFLVFAVVISLPTVVINSSLWGQSDSLYASFALLSLYFAMSDQPLLSALSLGAAFSLKLQCLFIAPVIVGYFFSTRKGRWWYLIIVPAFYVATLIPAVVASGSFPDLLLTYAGQAGEFQQLTLSAPSIFSFVDANSLSASASSALAFVGYILATAAAIFVFIQTMKNYQSDHQKLLLLALFSVLAIPFFLPHMHERYFYMADILSVIFAFSEPRYWFIPVLTVTASFLSYMPFLSGQVPLFARMVVPEAYPGALILAATAVVATVIWRTTRIKTERA